jgi:hypothetical protein
VTLSEWLEVQAVIQASWRNFTPPADMDVQKLQHRIVANVSKIEAIDAIVEIARDGAKWPPEPGEVVAKVREMRPPLRTLDDALEVFQRAVHQRAAPGTSITEADVLRYLQEHDPEVGRFVVEIGFGQLKREQVDDAQYGGAVRKRLGDEWAGTQNDVRREVLEEGRPKPLLEHRIRSLGGESTGELSAVGKAMKELASGLRPTV